MGDEPSEGEFTQKFQNICFTILLIFLTTDKNEPFGRVVYGGGRNWRKNSGLGENGFPTTCIR